MRETAVPLLEQFLNETVVAQVLKALGNTLRGQTQAGHLLCDYVAPEGSALVRCGPGQMLASDFHALFQRKPFSSRAHAFDARTDRFLGAVQLIKESLDEGALLPRGRPDGPRCRQGPLGELASGALRQIPDYPAKRSEGPPGVLRSILRPRRPKGKLLGH